MYKQKIALGMGGYGFESAEQQINAIADAGFDGFFSGADAHDDIMRFAEVGAKRGLIYQSIHAPFYHIDRVWLEGEAGDKELAILKECVSNAADAGVDLVVSHVWIGFNRPEKPSKLGIDRLGELVSFAAAKNVRIGFENTEGEDFLDYTMEAFKNQKNVGFTWDSGHEQCYNYGRDLLADYGDRLFSTHLNDNLGISDFNGKIFWTDDLHLLPFDGIIDWKKATEKLNKAGYNDILTFELNKTSKPNRHENDRYAKLTPEEYLAEVYTRACRVATLKLAK